MSIVPATGVLRKLYEDARTNIEYNSSAFWQIYLQKAFFEDNYIVVCEFPPDSSKRRVDIVVRKYDENHHTLSSFLFHECKRPNGSVSEVESQALNAARLAITTDKLSSVYVMTTIGTVPFVYIDADSDGAYELNRAINLAKAAPPLRVAPVIPSQSLADLEDTLNDFEELQEEYAPAEEETATAQKEHDLVEEDMGGNAAGEGGWGIGDAGGGPTMEGMVYGDYRSSAPEEDAEAGPSGTSTGRDDCGFMVVKVSRVPHSHSPDEYVFKDRKGRKVSTRKDEWTLGFRSEGQPIWTYQGKKMAYVSERKIGKDIH